MRYYDNPKGMIPTWLINWAAKVSVYVQSLSSIFLFLKFKISALSV